MELKNRYSTLRETIGARAFDTNSPPWDKVRYYTETSTSEIAADHDGVHYITNSRPGSIYVSADRFAAEQDPRWWGAAGDGSADDTDELQAAINYTSLKRAGNELSGVLNLGTGIYKISSSLVVTNGMTIAGSSPIGVTAWIPLERKGAMILVTGNTNAAALLVGKDGSATFKVYLRDFRVSRLAGETWAGTGIELRNGSEYSIQGVHINGGFDVGLRVKSLTLTPFRDMHLSANNYGMVIEDGIAPNTSLWFANCNFWLNDLVGIEFRGSVNGMTVRDSWIEYSPVGIRVAEPTSAGLGLRQVVFDGVTLSLGESGVSPIGVEIAGGTNNYPQLVDGMRFTDCIFYGSGSPYLVEVRNASNPHPITYASLRFSDITFFGAETAVAYSDGAWNILGFDGRINAQDDWASGVNVPLLDGTARLHVSRMTQLATESMDADSGRGVPLALSSDLTGALVPGTIAWNKSYGTLSYSGLGPLVPSGSVQSGQIYVAWSAAGDPVTYAGRQYNPGAMVVGGSETNYTGSGYLRALNLDNAHPIGKALAKTDALGVVKLTNGVAEIATTNYGIIRLNHAFLQGSPGTLYADRSANGASFIVKSTSTNDQSYFSWSFADTWPSGIFTNVAYTWPGDWWNHIQQSVTEVAIATNLSVGGSLSVGGTNVMATVAGKQPLDDDLTRIANVTWTLGDIVYSDSAGLTNFATTAAGRTLLAAVDAAAQRSALGLGAFATLDDAPTNGSSYVRSNGAWSVVPSTASFSFSDLTNALLLGANMSAVYTSSNMTISATTSGSTNGTTVSVDGGAALTTANLQDGARVGFSVSGTNVQADIVAGSIGTNELSSAAIAYLTALNIEAGTNVTFTTNGANVVINAAASSGGSTYTTNYLTVPLFTANTTNTVSASITAETNILTSIASWGSTNIAANALSSGSVLRLRAGGTLTATSDWDGGTLRFKVGGLTVSGVFSDDESWVPAGRPWMLDVTLHVVTAGATCVVAVAGGLLYDHRGDGVTYQSTASYEPLTFSGALDTTVGNNVALTFQNNSGQEITLVRNTATLEHIGKQTVLGGGGGTAGATKTILRWNAEQGFQPTSNPATFSARNTLGVMEFDPSTQESIRFRGIVPEGVSASSVTVIIKWTTSATSGDGRWGAKFWSLTGDIDSDSFATAVEGTTTTSGTAGTIMTTTLSSVGFDSAAAGDGIVLEIYRDVGDAADTINSNDLQLHTVEVRVP